MELHFCTVCGVSIPNAEVDTGAARGPGGEIRCTEHRDGDLEATPDEPRAARPAPAGDADLELLFCANCRVSVPMTDFRSGRARQEYGSLLCGVCVKADPGTRAARREAVEAEMAADVEANDPVAQRRCGVCSVAVPQSHIVTGQALVEGDRVTCQACRAVVSGSGSGGGFVKTVALVVVVAAIAGTVGYVVGPLLMKSDDDPTAPLREQIAALESEMNERFDGAATARAAERDDLARQIESMGTSVDSDLQRELTEVRAQLASVRSEVTREDGRSEKRIARLEGQIDEIVKRLAERASEPARDVTVRQPVDPPPRDPVKPDPPPAEPVVPQVNPEVVRLAKDLLESEEDSVRFPAANELGRLGDEAAIPALSAALLNDEHFLVRRACARSLNMLKAWNSTPYLIGALEDKEAYVAQQANFALRNITGQDFEVTQDQSVSERKRKAKKARKWWDDNKSSPPDGVSLHVADLPQ